MFQQAWWRLGWSLCQLVCCGLFSQLSKIYFFILQNKKWGGKKLPMSHLTTCQPTAIHILQQGDLHRRHNLHLCTGFLPGLGSICPHQPCCDLNTERLRRSWSMIRDRYLLIGCVQSQPRALCWQSTVLCRDKKQIFSKKQQTLHIVMYTFNPLITRDIAPFPTRFINTVTVYNISTDRCTGVTGDVGIS